MHHSQRTKHPRRFRARRNTRPFYMDELQAADTNLTATAALRRLCTDRLSPSESGTYLVWREGRQQIIRAAGHVEAAAAFASFELRTDRPQSFIISDDVFRFRAGGHVWSVAAVESSAAQVLVRAEGKR